MAAICFSEYFSLLGFYHSLLALFVLNDCISEIYLH